MKKNICFFSKLSRNLILVPIVRFSVVLRHANRLYINKNNIFNIYVLSIQGVGVSIVNEIPL